MCVGVNSSWRASSSFALRSFCLASVDVAIGPKEDKDLAMEYKTSWHNNEHWKEKETREVVTSCVVVRVKGIVASKEGLGTLVTSEFPQRYTPMAVCQSVVAFQTTSTINNNKVVYT